MRAPLLPAALLACGLAFVAEAAGPAKVASYERALWPQAITSPEAFDEASRREILAFVRAIDAVKLDDVAALKAFTGVKAPNLEGAQQWLARTRERLLENYQAASASCAGQGDCLGAPDWQALTHQAAEASRDAHQAAWRSAAAGFHTSYLYEQVRLAALFPAVTSEIGLFGASERDGFELPDRQFLFTFDDGPSPNDESEKLTAALREAGQEAFFFALGERLDDRLKKQDRWALAGLYQGQCLASHGYTHVPHAKLFTWQKSLDDTYRLIDEVQAGAATGRWFRPPYGQRSEEQLAYVQAAGGRVLLWNIDSQDWNAKLSAEAMRDRVMTLMLLWRRGVLLFHDTYPKARQALPALSTFMRASGLQTVSCHIMPER